VADEVAYARQVTPTACAGFLVERVRSWCTRRDEVLRRCLRAASAATDRSADRLERASGRVGGAARRHLRDAERSLDTVTATLVRRPRAAIVDADAALALRAGRVAALDPSRLLARGWSITRTDDGALVKGPADVAPGTRIRTTTSGGDLTSTIEAS
jgi:exodeoxyribonuclease VII large subunit